MSGHQAKDHETPEEDVDRSPSRRVQAAFYLTVAIVGAVTGLIGTVFHLLVDEIIQWPGELREMMDGPLLFVVSASISTTMICLSIYLVRRFAPEAGGSGVQEIEGALAGLRPLRWARVLPVKFFGGLLSLGSGLVVGREGPTIHMGASIAGALAQWTKQRPLETNGLLAAGAAAGLAAAFNAPLAAILFVIEETRRQFRYTLHTYTGVAIAAVLSTIVTEQIAGVGPDLEIVVPNMPLWTLSGFFVLGILLGGVGVVFNKALLVSMDVILWVNQRAPYLYPVVFGVIIGILVLILPDATYGGETLIMTMTAEHLALGALLLVVVVRTLSTLGSYATGAPGGIFAPILTLATSIGLAYAAVLQLVLPMPEAAPQAFAIAAMGGLFAAAVRAPMVGVVLTAELTGSYELILPTLVTCATANIIADWLGGEPIYEQLLERTLRLSGQQAAHSKHRTPVQLGWEDDEKR